MNLNGQFTTLIIGLLITITIFLLIRELICWYYKINVRVELQKETNNLLRSLIEKTESINLNNKQGTRIKKFPKPWLGDYLFYHYF